jgi:transposase
MESKPPLPDALWSLLPQPARDAVLGLVQFYQGRVEQLEAKVAELEGRLAQDSSNSHRPPSTDPPSHKPAPPRKPSGRRPGGQPGHARAVRPRLQPDRVIDHKPRACSDCGAALAGDDPQPRWRQVWDLPEVRPVVTEHRFHTLDCPCGRATAAADEAPAGDGPRLKAALVYLTGVAHLSKSQAEALCEDLLGTPVSTGQVCAVEAEAAEALAPVMGELRQALPKGHVNMDETGWKRPGKKAWLWVAVSGLFTLFHVARNRGGAVVRHLLGPGYAHVLTVDRWSAYNGVARRQLCWAHLRRDFQALIDRGGKGKGVGEELLSLSDMIFTCWHRVRDGTLTRKVATRRVLNWFAPDVKLALGRGAASGCARAEGLCRDLLGRWDQLWEFCRAEGVEPTNNAAERALRPAVLWRKRSQGCRSDVGEQYVAAALSVAATCKQQGRRVWDYLTEVFAAAAKGRPAPSLLPKP